MLRNGILKAGIPLIMLLVLLLFPGDGARAASMDAVWPETPGTDVRSDGKLVIDASNMSKGYIMVKSSEAAAHALKIRISNGQWQLNYDLNSEGNFEAFPLQNGSGTYEIGLFENVSGNKYASEGKVSLDVQLSDENAAYLVPNQYVNYELWTAAVQKSDELCADQPPQQVFDAVSNFLATEFDYDFVRAKTIGPGEKPDIDYCYDNRMGICQDLAAVTACMLRVQGVPAKLVIGYADKYYHAWCSVVLGGQEVLFDPTHAVGAINVKTYTVERMY